MAYVSGGVIDNKDEEEQDQDPAAAFASGGSRAVAPASGAAGGTPNIANPQNDQQDFAGIADYVKANKGQTANLANQLGGQVKEAGQEARTNLATGVNKFNTDVDKNTVKVNEGVFNAANTDATSVGAPTRFDNIENRQVNPNEVLTSDALTGFNRPGRMVNNSTPDPRLAGGFEVDDELSKEAQRAADLREFIKMRDAQYTGPQSLQEDTYFNPIDKSFAAAEDATENAKTEEGNRNLLDALQTKQLGYTNQGSLSLNNALLRGDLDARQTLQNAAASNSDLEGLLTGAVGSSVNRADTAENITNATRQKVADTFGGKQGKLEQDLVKRSDQAFIDAEGKSQQVVDNLRNGVTPSDEELNALGISREQWDEVKAKLDQITIYDPNVDITQYIFSQLPQITPQNIATEQEYAEYEALKRLMGTEGQFLSDPSLAGTADTDNVGFDIDTALADLGGKVGEIDADRAAFERKEDQRIQQINYNIGNAMRQGGSPAEVDPALFKRRPYPGPGRWS